MLAVCSVQRFRDPWIHEWLAFHQYQGVSRFYLYLDRADQSSIDLVSDLGKVYDLVIYRLDQGITAPQLVSYQHCYQNHGHEFDWCAFIDGDEFLFREGGGDLLELVNDAGYHRATALAVYWSVFGSSHHTREPRGMITENFRRRANLDHAINRQFKCLVRGRQWSGFRISLSSHWFHTLNQTWDLQSRPIEQAQWSPEGWIQSPWPADHSLARINHYATQSREYWVNSKQHHEAIDRYQAESRTETWFQQYDRNEVLDHSLEFMPQPWHRG